MKGAEETEVKITQRLYHDKSLVWTVYVDGEIFYKECRSFGRHFKKSGSKLEAFIDWLAGNEPDNIKINLSLLNRPNNRQNHQTGLSDEQTEFQRSFLERLKDASQKARSATPKAEDFAELERNLKRAQARIAALEYLLFHSGGSGKASPD
ncbi:MAG: hypothetical protein H3C36_02400 [Chitinophagaceae bacterium]|nr:hypothetical protein [Chitinophagaceae bacterium]